MDFKIGMIFLAMFAVLSANSLKIPIEKKIPPNSLTDNSSLALVLVDQNGLYYVTNVTFGTPPQLLTVSFSNYLEVSFIPSIKCSSCQAINVFDESKSSTYNATNIAVSITINNPEGTTVSGTYSFETFNIGGYTVQEQPFVDVLQEDNYDLPVDGVISLAYNQQSFVFKMHSQGLISDPILGYFISDTEGEISLGESDLNHYSGDLNFFNVTYAYIWSFHFDYRIPNNDSSKLEFYNEYVAMFDVANPNIEASPTNIKQINEALGAKLEEDGSYTFDCDKLDQYPPFTFIFKGLSYVLEPIDYIQMEDNKCVSYFANSKWFLNDQQFNIGQPFFRKYYTVFDFGNQRIGFATAK